MGHGMTWGMQRHGAWNDMECKEYGVAHYGFMFKSS